MPSLYRAPSSRLNLFSLPSTGTTVTTDSGLAFAILATPAADCAVVTESSGRVSSDRSAPLENSGLMSSDGGLPIEAAATLGSELVPLSEALQSTRIDPNVPIESLGTASVAVTGNTPLLIEVGATVRSDWGLTAEGLTTSRTDAGAELAAETLAGLAQDTTGSIEWSGSGAIVIADTMLPLEWQQTMPTALVSLESGPSRVRLLATPGRVRLVRRN
jgi:hypothetical protein